MSDSQKPSSAPLALVAPRVATSILVPIRSLGVGHRERIAAHLLALDTRDRYLRFGYNAADRNI